MLTQKQLARGLANARKSQEHERRMREEPAYRERIEREAAEYEQFCAMHGYPHERGQA